MVLYFTSKNFLVVKDLVQNYDSKLLVTPHEYMVQYINKNSENISDAKLAWLMEVFLGMHKHIQFLEASVKRFVNEFTDEDKVDAIIAIYTVIFHLLPSQKDSFYKCLFKVNKSVLHAILTIFSDTERLQELGVLAEMYFDAEYTAEMIMTSVLFWQASMSELLEKHESYLKDIEKRKTKPPTVPIQPKVLSRSQRNKNIQEEGYKPDEPAPCETEPVTNQSKKKMLTKEEIDSKLKHRYNENRQKALALLHEVRYKKKHYAEPKSIKYYKTLSDIDVERQVKVIPKPRTINTSKAFIRPRETISSLKRLQKNIEIEEQAQIKWLDDLVNNVSDPTKAIDFDERYRDEKRKEEVFEIERKHLLGQLSHEEAQIAKQKYLEENRKRYEEFLRDKEVWQKEIEAWRKLQQEKNRQQIEKMTLQELKLLESKMKNSLKKKENASKLKKESESLLERALQQKNEDLDRKIAIIKQMKVISMIAKKSQVAKIIDLTETSGLGLFSEMSIVELNERLSQMRMQFKEELENKRKQIMEKKSYARQSLEETRINVENYLALKSTIRKERKEQQKQSVRLDGNSAKEICELKKKLQEKKNLRMSMTLK